ncbi:unnamed protein product, partial [Ectocarpus sp. 12 AP-2014]
EECRRDVADNDATSDVVAQFVFVGTDHLLLNPQHCSALLHVPYYETCRSALLYIVMTKPLAGLDASSRCNCAEPYPALCLAIDALDLLLEAGGRPNTGDNTGNT